MDSLADNRGIFATKIYTTSQEKVEYHKVIQGMIWRAPELSDGKPNNRY